MRSEHGCARVMNNNQLLLPGRAINTQLTNTPSPFPPSRSLPRAAIRVVTHRHGICFRAASSVHVTSTTFLQILAPLLHVVYRDCSYATFRGPPIPVTPIIRHSHFNATPHCRTTILQFLPATRFQYFLLFSFAFTFPLFERPSAVHGRPRFLRSVLETHDNYLMRTRTIISNASNLHSKHLTHI